MNQILNRFLLTGDKFMPEKFLRQYRLTDSAFGPYIKKKERIKWTKKTVNPSYIYKSN